MSDSSGNEIIEKAIKVEGIAKTVMMKQCIFHGQYYSQLVSQMITKKSVFMKYTVNHEESKQWMMVECEKWQAQNVHITESNSM